jgi:hypothetical protein
MRKLVRLVAGSKERGQIFVADTTPHTDVMKSIQYRTTTLWYRLYSTVQNP